MTFRFSTSVQNFADRVRNKHGIYQWHPIRSLFDPTVFIGLYHAGDWSRFIWHIGPKLAFWCGGDILRLKEKPFWQLLVKGTKADHVCENEVEQEALKEMGIDARIHPILFFDPVDKYPLSFKSSKNPHVWMTSHAGREEEYGVRLIEEVAKEVPEVNFHIFGSDAPNKKIGEIEGEYNVLKNKIGNIRYYGWIPTEKMDEIIKLFHCGFRGNSFDGCPHTVSKAMLLGQYAISRIKYPYVDFYETKEELIKLLKELKNKTKPNLEGRKYWKKILEEYPWS